MGEGQTNVGLTNTFIPALASSDTNLFAGTWGGGVFLTTNNGTSWVQSGLMNSVVQAFAITSSIGGSEKILYAGTSGNGVFMSTNNGTNWTAVNSGLGNRLVQALAVSDTNLFAGTSGGGIFLSTNNGTSWAAVNNGLTDTYVYSIAVSGTNLFIGTGGGVFCSTNNGTSWIATGLTATNVGLLAVSGTNLFAWGGGFFRSTDNGISWTSTDYLYPMALAVSGANLIASTVSGVFMSTNYGTSWTAVNTGLTNTSVYSLAVSRTNLFGGTFGGGVWKRPLSEMIIDNVEPSPNQLPTQYVLSQNYPNPFNPTTAISYQLPTQTQVTLKVFDVLGREVATLVNSVEEPGSKTVRFDADNLPSGLYFYRLQAGNYIHTKKLLLLR